MCNIRLFVRPKLFLWKCVALNSVGFAFLSLGASGSTTDQPFFLSMYCFSFSVSFPCKSKTSPSLFLIWILGCLRSILKLTNDPLLCILYALRSIKFIIDLISFMLTSYRAFAIFFVTNVFAVTWLNTINWINCTFFSSNF